MGMKRVQGNRGYTEEIYKMDTEIGQRDAKASN